MITAYGLKKDVSCVQCEFCIYDGRSGGDDKSRKRAQTNHVQMFTPPYRPELYRKHLEGQHADQWLVYKDMTKALKKEYFATKKKAAYPTLSSMFQPKSGGNNVLELTIARDIVDKLIGTLYFHPDDDVEDGEDAPLSKANALKLFKLKENSDGSEASSYSVTITNAVRFWLAIDHTSAGLSF